MTTFLRISAFASFIIACGMSSALLAQQSPPNGEDSIHNERSARTSGKKDSAELVQQRMAAIRTIADHLGLKVTEGSDGRLEIEKIAELADQRFKVGDKIIEANGEPVVSLDQLGEIVTSAKSGNVHLKLARGSETGEMTVPFLEAPPDMEIETEAQTVNFSGMTLMSSDEAPAIVAEVASHTPAWESGIREGDRLLSIDGVTVDSFESLQESLRDALVDPQRMDVPVLAQRGQERMELTVRARTPEQIANRMRRGGTAEQEHLPDDRRAVQAGARRMPQTAGGGVSGQDDVGSGYGGSLGVVGQPVVANALGNQTSASGGGIVVLQPLNQAVGNGGLRRGGTQSGPGVAVLAQTNGGVQVRLQGSGFQPLASSRRVASSPANRQAAYAQGSDSANALADSNRGDNLADNQPVAIAAIASDGDLRRYSMQGPAAGQVNAQGSTNSTAGNFIMTAPLQADASGVLVGIFPNMNLQQAIGRAFVIFPGTGQNPVAANGGSSPNDGIRALRAPTAGNAGQRQAMLEHQTQRQMGQDESLAAPGITGGQPLAAGVVGIYNVDGAVSAPPNAAVDQSAANPGVGNFGTGNPGARDPGFANPGGGNLGVGNSSAGAAAQGQPTQSQPQ